MTLSAVRDHRGDVVNYVAVSGDISQQRAAEDQIRFMAYFDALTGLPNRALLKDRAEQLFAHAHREHGEVAVLFLDLDHFKNINDSLGHAIGDQLLQALARRLESTLRAEDTVGRLGGDEFLVVARCTDTGGVARLADKLLEVASEPIEIDGRTLTVTPSIGISMFPRDGGSFADLLKNADIELYKAKDAGRAMYHFFTPEMNEQAVERLTLEHDIRRALNNEEFVLHYQPQMRLSDGAITGAEALIRWNHPERGLLMPGRFISVAEQSGLIARIGVWVLREACRQAQAWRGAGLPSLRVSVNISVRQLAFYDLAAIIESILEETSLPPQLLELEITESLLAQNVDDTLNVLKQIRSQGVELAVDDFGTGYSSLSYLKRFPISKLKIDQSFVRDLLSDPDDRAIARAIVTLGHNLGMKVTAEGVESEEHLEILRLIGCDEIQGYLFGQPLPADALMHALPALGKLAQHASNGVTVGF
jgi:diguanylate cyclase (GGDEF)-like protein